YLVKREEERKVKTDLHTLSKRQRETLDLVAEGLTNSQIANRLFVSESTVKQRLGNIYKILDISSRTDAVKLLYNAEQVSSETL
ncbi:MAG: helix-turn-helix transcriptional regulator, partial [Actinomycetota bacterium]|nr:helix-turn-helix transcriptional regulator [Actinomycetota bacterium]